MFDAIKLRLAAIPRVGERALPRAAARIEAKLRQDATTKRGNVPAFGKFPGGPITAEATAEGVDAFAPDWVMRIARARSQPKEWVEIMREEVRAEFERGGQ